MKYVETLSYVKPLDRRWQAALEIVGVMGAMVVAAQAKLFLPFTPVPITFQTFVALAAPFMVGAFNTTAGMLLYVLLGLCGVPWFAAVFGPTFGYLAAFVALPSLIVRFRNPAWGILAGTLAIYVVGALWLSLWLQCSLLHAVAVGVLPFVPGDLLKAVLAYAAVRRVCGDNDSCS